MDTSSNTDAARALREAEDLIRQERYEAALAAMPPALATDDVELAARAWGLRTATLQSLGRLPEALAAAERATKTAPSLVMGPALRAGVLNKLGRHDEALASVRQALELGPHDAWLRQLEGDILRRLGCDEEAVAAYGEALRLGLEPERKRVAALVSQARALFALRRFSEASEAARLAAELIPTHPAAWDLAGSALFELQRYDEALEAFQHATDAMPKSASAWSNTGFALYMMDRARDAIAAYDRALVITPDDWHVRAKRAAALARALLDAGEALPVDVATEPELANPKVWMREARWLRQLGRHDEALRACDHALELNPTSADAAVGRVLILVDQRHYIRALGAIRLATKQVLRQGKR